MPAGATRATTYADGTKAALALFSGRLAWRVTYRAASDAVYDVLVDAVSGKLLRRANLVKSDAPARVWENYPGRPTVAPRTTVDLTPRGSRAARSCSARTCTRTRTSTTTTARSRREEVVPGSYDFVRVHAGSGCCAAEAVLVVRRRDHAGQTNRKQNAVQAFYLANRFHDHLAGDPINFTDRSFEGTDRLLLETDDGADTPLGSPHQQREHVHAARRHVRRGCRCTCGAAPNFRTMNGGDDASILYHEYTHGLSNRLVRDADGAGALNSPQAGAMGEGWSDWYAKDFLVSQSLEARHGGAGRRPHGRLHRRHRRTRSAKPGLDCPVLGASAARASPTATSARSTAGRGALRRRDLGRDAVGPANRDRLVEARRIVTQAMRLSPPEPSFLDMRNAILLAASAAQRDAVWTVFAGRGMGYYASTTGSEDISPVEDFTTPPLPGAPRRTISGRVTDSKSGQPVAPAAVALGSLSATAGPDGRYTLSRLSRRTTTRTSC